MKRFLIVLTVLLPALALAQVSPPKGGGNSSVTAGTSDYLLNVAHAPYSVDLTGSVNAAIGIQAAVDACPAPPTGCHVFLPCGKYRGDSPVRVKRGYIRISGEGSCTQFVNSAQKPNFIIGPDWPAPAVVDSPSGDGVKGFEFYPSTNGYLFEMSQGPFLNGTYTVDGLHSIQIAGWYTPHDAGGPYYLMYSRGGKSSSVAVDSAFSVMNSSGSMIAHVQLSGSGSVTCTKSGVFAGGVAGEFEVNYDDGAGELRGFKNGTKVTWDSCVGGIGPTGLTGTVVQKPWEDMAIGPTYTGIRFQNSIAAGPNGTIGEFQLRYNNGSNTWFHTANYSTASAIPFDGGTLWALAGTWTGPFTGNYFEPNNHQTGMVVWNTVDGTQNSDVEIDHIRFSSSSAAIVAFSQVRLSAHNLVIEGPSRVGIRCKDNCYGSSFRDITGYVSQGYASYFMDIEHTGLVTMDNVYAYGAMVPIYVHGSIIGTQLYATPTTSPPGLSDLIITGTGFLNQFANLSYIALGNEVGYLVGAPLQVDSLTTLTVNGADFQSAHDITTPAAYVLLDKGDIAASPSVVLNGVEWDSGGATTEPPVRVSLIGSWNRKSVRISGDYIKDSGLVPMSDHPEWIVTDPQQGTCTVTGAATTCSWTYPRAEMDTASMSVPCNVSAISASAASNSWRIKSCTKTTTAATATLEVAPGGSETITVDFSTRR